MCRVSDRAWIFRSLILDGFSSMLQLSPLPSRANLIGNFSSCIISVLGSACWAEGPRTTIMETKKIIFQVHSIPKHFLRRNTRKMWTPTQAAATLKLWNSLGCVGETLNETRSYFFSQTHKR